MHAPPSHRHHVIKENVPHRDRAAVAVFAEDLLSRDPNLRVADAVEQAVEAYRRDPAAVHARDGSLPETPLDYRERILRLSGAGVIGLIVFYAYLAGYWWVLFVGEGLLLLLGAIHWSRRTASASPPSRNSF